MTARQLDLRPITRAAVRTRAPGVSIVECARTDDCRRCFDVDVCSTAQLIYGPAAHPLPTPTAAEVTPRPLGPLAR